MYLKKNKKRRKKRRNSSYNSCLRGGLSFRELSTVSPKHEDARQGAISIAKIVMNDEALKEVLFTTKRLPIKRLESKVQVSRKTIERNRKYIIAICVC